MTDGGTPSNGIILLAWVSHSGGTAITGFDGYGQTWTKMGAEPAGTLELWACITASATSTAPVLTVSGSPTGAFIHIIEVTGAYVSGSISDAFEEQSAGVYVAVATDAGTPTTLSVTLLSPANAANRPFAAFKHATNEAKTPRASWTELTDQNYNSPPRGLESQYRSDTHETTASATWATGLPAQAIACTIREASAPPGGGTTVEVTTAGAVTFTGSTVLLIQTQALAAGAVTFAGQTVNFLKIQTLTPGAVTFTGQTVNIGGSVVVGVTPGAVTLTGQTVLLRQSQALTPGAVTFAGQAIQLRTFVPVTPGALTLAGQTVALRQLQALTPGAVTFTGQTVNVPSSATILTVVPGAITFAGQSVTVPPPVVFYIIRLHGVHRPVVELAGRHKPLIELRGRSVSVGP
jgi:hypothetical protein